MTIKSPVTWQSRPRLRLHLVGGLVALHDDAGVIPPASYVVDAAAGIIALTAEPKGEVRAEVAPPAPTRAGKPVEAA